MPTKEWFRENPKVTAYVSQDLYSKLDNYMKAEGIKKVSQALTIILEEKFSVRKPINANKFQEELDTLKSKVAQIELLLNHKADELIDLDGNASDERYNQLTLSETSGESDGEPSKVDQSSSDLKRLTTKDIEELTGLSRQKLEYKRKTGRLPYTIKGYTIIRWVEKERKQPYSNVWEVQEASSS